MQDLSAKCRAPTKSRLIKFSAILFAQHGAETISATCVSEAIEKIHQFQPDFLISEIALPKEDGYSLIRQLRSFEIASGVQIPAIALTARAEAGDRIQALAAGFCTHLPKPVNIDELIATITELTRQTQAVSPTVHQ